MTKTYLEFSDPNGAEHKFYEVTVDGADLTIRYGRIGTEGQSSTKAFPDAAKAQAEADRKIREKRKKGYEDAVMGVRQKRSVVRREVTETKSTTRQTAPVLWRFKTKNMAFGIFVDDQNAWVGNNSGEVFALSLAGEVNRSFQLPDGVKCLVSDAYRTFAGCDDGNVYDLSGKLPFVAYEVEGENALLWLDLHGGTLGVTDSNGGVFAFDAESDQQWGHVDDRASMGWMVRVDARGVYYGHSRGVGMFDRESGFPNWHQATRGAVLFGWQEGNDLYAGTSANLIQRFTKAGEHVQDYQCDGSVLSCAASPGGEFVFAGDSGSAVYCFTRAGERLWKLGSGCASALSMQFAADKLYIVTTNGTLAAIDVNPAAIEAARQGQTPAVKDVKLAAAMQAQAPATELTVTRNASGGVLLKAVKEGGKLRIRPDDTRFDKTWNVQFPRDLREVNGLYVVDDLEDAGGFYRVVGDIRKLEN